MKEISEKLAKELYAMIENAEAQASKAYVASKKGKSAEATRHALRASVFASEARLHLLWHMEGYLNSENQLPPLDC